MPTELLSMISTVELPQSVADQVIGLAGTYFIHSTLLISGVWLLCCRAGPVPQDQLWKLAIALPLGTTLIQLSAGAHLSLFSLPLAALQPSVSADVASSPPTSPSLSTPPAERGRRRLACGKSR